MDVRRRLAQIERLERILPKPEPRISELSPEEQVKRLQAFFAREPEGSPKRKQLLEIFDRARKRMFVARGHSPSSWAGAAATEP